MPNATRYIQSSALILLGLLAGCQGMQTSVFVGTHGSGLGLSLPMNSTSTRPQAPDRGIRRIRIASQLVDCTGIAPQRCFSVQWADPTGKQWSAWQTLAEPIEGFTWQAGTTYELLIREIYLDPPPATGSALRRSLLQIVKAEPAP